MTFQTSAPRKKQRWLALLVGAMTVFVFSASLVSAHGVTTVPARYAGGTQVDSDPPPAPSINDVPGQVDMTQMGRDTSANPDVRIFWNWDSISSWAGNGQTGDACALFDTDDTDAFINYVICARVQNNGTPGDVVLLPASTNHPAYLFDCSNKKNDRCTNPVPRAYSAGQVLAGPLTVAANTLTQTGAGDLITETDPFAAGESAPHDTSIEILVDGQGADSLVPANVRLANVCSYPSAGNGGNNNPFDCVVTPGIQYGTLRVTKVVTNDNGGTATFGNFSYSVDGGTAAAFPADDGTIDIQVPVGNHSVAETTIATGYIASYANSINSNTNCTSLAVTAGQVTTCTITNNDNAPALHLRKTIDNGNGGTAAATDWTLTATGTGATPTNLSGSTPVDSGSTFKADTYTLGESGPSGYTAGAWNCGSATMPTATSVTVPFGGDVTCTINNDDNAPALHLRKTIDNGNGGTAAATDWTLTATGTGATPTNLSGSTPVDSGSTFKADTYTLGESGPSGYTAGAWNCGSATMPTATSVTVPFGGDVTCTINNDDDIASPGISTVMKWTLNDRSVMTGWVDGGGPSTVTFTLYKDTAEETSCEDTTKVHTEIVDVEDTDGSAATEIGYPTEDGGTYRWIASFSGNSFNAAIASDCNAEVTTLP